jgi:hypothetical protein
MIHGRTRRLYNRVNSGVVNLVLRAWMQTGTQDEDDGHAKFKHDISE